VKHYIHRRRFDYLPTQETRHTRTLRLHQSVSHDASTHAIDSDMQLLHELHPQFVTRKDDRGLAFNDAVDDIHDAVRLIYLLAQLMVL
jgi:hypothetical protein